MSPRRPENPPLDREHAAGDPLEQFGAWFARGRAGGARCAEAMTLATVDADGAPNARMVLLKGFGPDGFRFFSNYESAKGAGAGVRTREPRWSIYWRELDRQVRVRGKVERLSAADSDAYFASRPRDSRIAAAISPQSRPIEREELERSYKSWLRAGRSRPVPDRSTGAAIWSAPRRSSSGRAATAACMTASSTRASPTALDDRAPSALARRAAAPGSGARPGWWPARGRGE